jgi:hypothetical protein
MKNPKAQELWDEAERLQAYGPPGNSEVRERVVELKTEALRLEKEFQGN